MASAAASVHQAERLTGLSNTLVGRRSVGAGSANMLAAHPLVLVQVLALALALISATECHMISKQAIPNVPILPDLTYGAIFWYWWGLVATALWKFALKSGGNFFSPVSALKQGCAGILIGAAHLCLLQANVTWSRAHWAVLRSVEPLHYLTLDRFFFELLLYGFISGLTGAIYLQVMSQREKMRTVSLERQLSVAHLRALQAQIEPHFLFNTLNAITSLVEQDRRKQALGTLRNLTSILRSTLRRNAPEKVSVAQELQLIDDYLSIELTRFADRLQLDMDIDRGTLDAQLPCFLLQPIVENAIRHGVSRCQEGGFVEIKIERKEARLCVTVRNSVPATDAQTEPGHGIGLTNTRERLALFYGDNYELRAGMSEAWRFEVSISLPYEGSA